MRFMQKIMIFSLCVMLGLSLVACTGKPSKENLFYPDYGYADANSDSWKQIDDLDEKVDITWYIDTTSFTGDAALVDILEEKFNVSVKFINPINDDGTYLSTLITGGNLPDIVTLTDQSTRVQLEDDGMAYPINILAEKYAPTLLNRIPQEETEYYKSSDGNLYGLANNFYADDKLAEFYDLGLNMQACGAVAVRKDYLEQYLKAFPDKANSAIKASEFIQMCKWVRNNCGNYQSNSQLVTLEAFTADGNTDGSRAITTLMDFFSVPPEDNAGNLTYRQATPEYKEMMMFLNTLYSNGLLTNLGANHTQVNSYIANGTPFVFIGYPQDYVSGFRSALKKSESIEYVPIMLTNEDGDIPQLLSIDGRGLRFSMITNKCERVDRIIKIFDYLMSEEGHRDTYYGVEGDTYEWVHKPGEVVMIDYKDIDGVTKQKEHTYQYGLIEWTDKAWNSLQNGTFTQHKIRTYNLLQDPMYPILTNANGYQYGLNLHKDFVQYNIKSGYLPYVYSRIPFRYSMYSDEEKLYSDMVDLQKDLDDLWIESFSAIIVNESQGMASRNFDSVLAQARDYGYEELLEYQNSSFLKTKQGLGIKFAYPPNDANSGYSALQVKSINGSLQQYYIPIPDNVRP